MKKMPHNERDSDVIAVISPYGSRLCALQTDYLAAPAVGSAQSHLAAEGINPRPTGSLQRDLRVKVTGSFTILPTLPMPVAAVDLLSTWTLNISYQTIPRLSTRGGATASILDLSVVAQLRGR